MRDEVQIPISMHWSKEEVVHVVNFFDAVDQVHRRGMERDLFLAIYREFKKVVPSKSEEKQLCKDYESQVEQSCYLAVKKMKEEKNNIKIKL